MSMVETDGISYNIYFAGCSIRCPGCHNQELWEQENNQKTTTDDVFEALIVNMEIADYVCILGGEPLDQYPALVDLITKINEINVPVWLYTGHDEDDIPIAQLNTLRKLCSVIKFGPYDPAYPKTGTLATGNQLFRKYTK